MANNNNIYITLFTWFLILCIISLIFNLVYLLLKKKEYSKNGFVIGDHNLSTIKNWIGNRLNYILVAEDLEKEGNPIRGYIFVLSTEDIIKKVQQYCKETVFEDNYYKDIIDNGNFKYLIQVAVSKGYQSRGIGTTMFDKLFKEVTDPIISYVIKSPILNEISLYTHLKLGFAYMGTYIGKYKEVRGKEFENYQSFGLIYVKSKTPRKERHDILKLIDDII